MSEVCLSEDAAEVLAELRAHGPEALRKLVEKALRLLGDDPAYPGLKSKKLTGHDCPHGVETWQSRVNDDWRIFWCRGHLADHATDAIFVWWIGSHP